MKQNHLEEMGKGLRATLSDLALTEAWGYL